MARNSDGTQATNYIDVGASINTMGCTSAISAAIWFYPTSITGNHAIAEQCDFSAFNEVMGFINLGGVFWGRVEVATTGKLTVSGGTITNNAWSHIALTYNGSTLNVYGNGSTVAAGASGTGNLVTAGIGTLKIFRRGEDLSLGGFAGNLADFAIWNVALTASEISALAKGVRPLTIRQKSMVAWWPLDGKQSPEPDLSGNKNNGTINGTVAAANGPPIMMFTPRWPRNVEPASAAGVVPQTYMHRTQQAA